MKIAEYLKENRITAKQFAQKLEISSQYLTMLIKQCRRVTLPLAKKIIELSEGKITIEDLIFKPKVSQICSCCGSKYWKELIDKSEKKE